MNTDSQVGLLADAEDRDGTGNPGLESGADAPWSRIHWVAEALQIYTHDLIDRYGTKIQYEPGDGSEDLYVIGHLRAYGYRVRIRAETRRDNHLITFAAISETNPERQIQVDDIICTFSDTSLATMTLPHAGRHLSLSDETACTSRQRRAAHFVLMHVFAGLTDRPHLLEDQGDDWPHRTDPDRPSHARTTWHREDAFHLLDEGLLEILPRSVEHGHSSALMTYNTYRTKRRFNLRIGTIGYRNLMFHVVIEKRRSAEHANGTVSVQFEIIQNAMVYHRLGNLDFVYDGTTLVRLEFVHRGQMTHRWIDAQREDVAVEIAAVALAYLGSELEALKVISRVDPDQPRISNKSTLLDLDVPPASPCADTSAADSVAPTDADELFPVVPQPEAEVGGEPTSLTPAQTFMRLLIGTIDAMLPRICIQSSETPLTYGEPSSEEKEAGYLGVIAAKTYSMRIRLIPAEPKQLAPEDGGYDRLAIEIGYQPQTTSARILKFSLRIFNDATPSNEITVHHYDYSDGTVTPILTVYTYRTQPEDRHIDLVGFLVTHAVKHHEGLLRASEARQLAPAIDTPDSYHPQAYPCHRLWGSLLPHMNRIVEFLDRDPTAQRPVSYAKPHTAAYATGHLGFVRYQSHVMRMHVVFGEPTPNTTNSIRLRVAFKDPLIPIRDMIALIPVMPNGDLREKFILRWRKLPNETVQDVLRFQHSTSPGECIEELLILLINYAGAHRKAHFDEVAGENLASPQDALPPEKANPTSESGAAQDSQDRTAWELGDDDTPSEAVQSEEGPDALFPDLDHTTVAGRTPVQIYDLEALRRELAVRPPGEGRDRHDPSQTKMIERLHQLGEAGARRWLEHAQTPMLQTLAALGERAPHFAPVTDLVMRYARASLNTGTPLRLPPLLIVDEPGTGKTWYLSRLAHALHLPFTGLSMAAVTTSDTIQGTHPVWRNSAQGLVSKLLLSQPIANPMIFVDEFDKPTGEGGGRGSLYRPYYGVLDRENARTFTDDFLGIAVNAAYIQWVLAANDAEPIPVAIRDRVMQVKLAPMTAEHRRVVAGSIYESCNAEYQNWYDPQIPDDALAVLEAQTPRKMRKAIDLALTSAGADNRRMVSAQDIRDGLAQAIAADAKATIGFTAHRA